MYVCIIIASRSDAFLGAATSHRDEFVMHSDRKCAHVDTKFWPVYWQFSTVSICGSFATSVFIAGHTVILKEGKRESFLFISSK